MSHGPDPRPYLLGSAPHDVRVPARVARWLSAWTNLDARRGEQRGRDGEVDAVLLALRLAALSPDGQQDRPGPADTGSWISTERAAVCLGVSARSVRRYIREGRLRARRVGAVWLVDRGSLDDVRRNTT